MDVGKGDWERPRDISLSELHVNIDRTFGTLTKEVCPTCQHSGLKIYYGSSEIASGTRECKCCRHRWVNVD